jgi:hypothetical protein
MQSWVCRLDLNTHSQQEHIFQTFRSIIEAPIEFEIHRDRLRLFGAASSFYKVSALTVPFTIATETAENEATLAALLLYSEGAFTKAWDGLANTQPTSYTRCIYNDVLERELVAIRLDLARSYAAFYATIAAGASEQCFYDVKLMLKSAAERYEMTVLKRSRNTHGDLVYSESGAGLSEHEKRTHARALDFSAQLHSFIRDQITHENLLFLTHA